MKHDAVDETEIYKTSKEGFMMAFALQDYLTGEIKDDPRFLKWFAQYTTVSEDGESSSREVKLTPCTDDDFARLETPDRRSRNKI